MRSKVCRGCLKWNPYSEFYRDNNNADGYKNICKLCQKVEVKNWYIKHRERMILRRKIYKSNHIEKEREYDKNWRKKKREQERIKNSSFISE